MSALRKVLIVLGAIFAVLIAFVLVRSAIHVIGGPDEVERVETAIESYYETGGAWACEHRATSSYLEARYEAREPYAKAFCATESASPVAVGVAATVTHVDGDRAQARVRFYGGSFDGSTTLVGLVQEDGYWRLNTLDSFVDFDTAAFLRGYRAQLIASGASRASAACVLDGVSRLSKTAVEHALIVRPSTVFIPITVRCDREGTIRELLAAGVEGTSDLTDAGLSCLERRLGAATDAELVRLTTSIPESIALRERCNPGYLADFARRSLRSSEDPATVRCVGDRLEALPLRAATAVVYDEESYEELVDRCD